MTPQFLSIVFVLVLVLCQSLAFAQHTDSPVLETSFDHTTARYDVSTPQSPDLIGAPPAMMQQELDQILAPIALYPDALLSHILMAATYPLEVVAASRWSKANPALEGEAAVQAVAEMPWDPSVKSLVAFPRILLMLDEKLIWMEQLGEAFLTQQAQVMETVQQLRQRAAAAGNLESDDHQQVERQGDIIAIEPASPQIVYVPYYDPRVIYGPGWWPAYRPIYWAPWPGYYYGPRLKVGFTWGLGISVGPRLFFGLFDWPHRHVSVLHVHNAYYRPAQVNRDRVWTHNPVHRRGVRYRTPMLQHQFGHLGNSPEVHRQFNEDRRLSVGGYDGRKRFQEGSGLRSSLPLRFNAPGGNRPDQRVLRNRASGPRERGARVESRGGFREQSVTGGGSARQFRAPANGRPQVRTFQFRPSAPRELGGHLKSRGVFRERSTIRGGKGWSSRSFSGPRGSGGGRSHHRRR